MTSIGGVKHNFVAPSIPYHSRRYSTPNLEVQDRIAANKFITPMPPKARRHSIVSFTDLSKAPVKKISNHRLYRHSISEGSTVNIRKRLNFDVLDGKRKMDPLLSALHNNDLAVPFSELDVACVNNHKKKRVKFSDDIQSSPAPETPISDPNFRSIIKKPAVFKTEKDNFTKLVGKDNKTSIKNLFNIGQTEEKDPIFRMRKSARNLTLLWQ